MKFRLIFETTTKNGNPVQIKFKVPPSKHQGVVNFLKIALEDGNPVDFFVEKTDKEKQERGRIKGTFKLENVPDADTA